MYNLDAIKAQLNKAASKQSGTAGTGDLPKINYWKATIGEHDIRFLPYQDSQGQPFQEVLYYKQPFVEPRVVAPCTFGMPDPIKETFEILRKDRDKDKWKTTKLLQPQERFYAVIIVRGEEEEKKGPQLWEMSKDIRDDIYKVLTHKDNVDEQMFDPEVGYDFTITVTQATDPSGKPRTFNGYPVKSYTPMARKKPSKLHAKAAQVKAWLEAMPKLEEFFKRQVKSPEDCNQLLEAFVARNSASGASPPSSPEGTVHNPKTPDDASAAASKKVDDVFAGV